MKCPHCKKNLLLQNYVEYNVHNERKPALAKTICCGKGVKVYPIHEIEVFAYTGDKEYDDWGDVFDIKENKCT